MPSKWDQLTENFVYCRIANLQKLYGMVPYNALYTDEKLSKIPNLRQIIFKLLRAELVYNPCVDHLLLNNPYKKSKDVQDDLPLVKIDIDENIIDDSYLDGFDPRKLNWIESSLDSKGKPHKKGPYFYTNMSKDNLDSVRLFNWVVEHLDNPFGSILYHGYKYWVRKGGLICRRQFTAITPIVMEPQPINNDDEYTDELEKTLRQYRENERKNNN